MKHCLLLLLSQLARLMQLQGVSAGVESSRKKLSQRHCNLFFIATSRSFMEFIEKSTNITKEIMQQTSAACSGKAKQVGFTK